MERCLKLKDPLAPNIPEKFHIPHYLTAPFRIRDKDRWGFGNYGNTLVT